MGKLKPFDNQQSKWEGLWFHPEYNSYSSATFDLSDLREYKGKVKIVVKKNRWFNNGENGRPNYLFCIKDVNSPKFKTIDIVSDEDEDDEESVQEMIEELAEIMEEGNRNADISGLASDSVSRSNSLFEQAIEIIEKLTGAKWEWTYTTY